MNFPWFWYHLLVPDHHPKRYLLASERASLDKATLDWNDQQILWKSSCRICVVFDYWIKLRIFPAAFIEDHFPMAVRSATGRAVLGSCHEIIMGQYPQVRKILTCFFNHISWKTIARQLPHPQATPGCGDASERCVLAKHWSMGEVTCLVDSISYLVISIHITRI